MRFRILTFLLSCLVATPVPAQDIPLPALYYVTGVAKHDTLNIRQRPSGNSPILSTLDPHQQGVEVMHIENGWGRVGNGEAMGWVYMRYLQAQPTANPFALPRPVWCFGTEPFWSLKIDRRGGQYSDFMAGELALTETWQDLASGTRGFAYGLVLESPQMNVNAVIIRDSCGDGMSDREYGLQIHAFFKGPLKRTLQTGCCTLEK